MTEKNQPAKDKPASCPICRKPVDPKYKPFCSKRCGDVDLNRWLKNSYSIAGAPVDDDPADDPSEH